MESHRLQINGRIMIFKLLRQDNKLKADNKWIFKGEWSAVITTAQYDTANR